MENLTEFDQEILEILKQLEYCCQEINLHNKKKDGVFPIMISDIHPRHHKGVDGLYHTERYLRNHKVKFTVTFDFENEFPEMYIDSEHPDERFIQLGTIEGNIQDIISTIKKLISNFEEIKETNQTPNEAPIPILTQKTKFTSKVKIEEDVLRFGMEAIPVERGQKSMAKLLLKNAKEFRGKKIIKRGKPTYLSELKQAGNYVGEGSFRDGLKRFRKKIKKSDQSIKIENVGTKKYQMEIHYENIKKQ